jgi:putative tricarboxylic transport membrane protein
MRRSLSISQGNWSIFVTHGISALLLGLTVLILVTPLVVGILKKRKRAG